MAVGAAAGLTVQRCLSFDASNPEKLFWAFAAGFVSHVILDALPHKEYSIDGLRLELVLLTEISIVFALILSSRNDLLPNSLIFFGMAGGAMPDVISGGSVYMFSWPGLNSLGRIIHILHFRSQSYSGFVFNFYTQAVLAILAVVFVRFKSAS